MAPAASLTTHRKPARHRLRRGVEALGGQRDYQHLCVEPLEDRRLLAIDAVAPLAADIIPNDARFHQQWGLEAAEAPAAWALTTGRTHVTTAVIDTGVDYTHPDLYKNIWINQNEIPQTIRNQLQDTDGDGLITFWDLNDPSGVNIGDGMITDLNGTGYIDGGDILRPFDEGGWADGKDNRANGYVDDLVGWDFVDNDNDPMDVQVHVTPGHRSRFGHGTSISGVIGAEGNNEIGVAGINWQAQIMALRFSPAFAGGTLAEFETSVIAATESVRYATANEARVSNLSAAAPFEVVAPELSQGIFDAFEEAGEHDHLIVGIAGNDSLDADLNARFPWHFDLDNLIVVAATSDAAAEAKLDTLATFSNYGSESVDLAAPGDWIWSTAPIDGPNSGYDQRSGTSQAAPHVAGAAALILSRNPDLSAVEVKSLILDNVDLLPTLDGKTVTGGRLNIFKAVSSTPLQAGVAPMIVTADDQHQSITGFVASPVWLAATSHGLETSYDSTSQQPGVYELAGASSWESDVRVGNDQASNQQLAFDDNRAMMTAVAMYFAELGSADDPYVTPASDILDQDFSELGGLLNPSLAKGGESGAS